MAAQNGVATAVRVLGAFAVEQAGRPVDIGGPQRRALLALLAARAGRVLPVSVAVDQLWGDDPPADAVRTVRSYLSRLRAALLAAGAPPGLLRTVPPGYQLDPALGTVDALGFERAVDAGRRALRTGDPLAAAGLLEGALALWRGPAYAEFADVPALAAQARRLDQLRRLALQERIEADLTVGLGPELLAELADLTEAYPEDERLAGQHMIALYRAGRQTDALHAYRRARQRLVEEGGLEPSPPLTEIHRRVLTHDPALYAHRRTGTAPVTPTGEIFTRTVVLEATSE